MVCLVGVTKNSEQALLIFSYVLKLPMSYVYSYSNDCSPFHQFENLSKLFNFN